MCLIFFHINDAGSLCQNMTSWTDFIVVIKLCCVEAGMNIHSIVFIRKDFDMRVNEEVWRSKLSSALFETLNPDFDVECFLQSHQGAEERIWFSTKWRVLFLMLYFLTLLWSSFVLSLLNETNLVLVMVVGDFWKIVSMI